MADEKNDPLAALRAAGLKRQQEAEAAKAAEDEARRAALAGLAGKAAKPAEDSEDQKNRALDALRNAAPTGQPHDDQAAKALDALRNTPAPEHTSAASSGTEATLAALRADTQEEQPMIEAPHDPADELNALLEDLPPAESDDLSALLGDDTTAVAPEDDDLANILAGIDASADIVAETTPPKPDGDGLDDLDSLLGGLHDTPASVTETEGVDASSHDSVAEVETNPSAGDLDDLDALLGNLQDPSAAVAEATPDPLDDLLDSAEPIGAPPAASAPQIPFGVLSAPRPAPEALARQTFRMAILGDFTGRAARGAAEIGPALAARRAIKLDVDTVEDVIEGFATTLILPVGKDGEGIEVRLGSLDDLHPDELFENVELFEALGALRQRLATASTSAAAVREMVGWAGLHDVAAQSPRRRSSGSSVPADRPLDALHDLIGGTRTAVRASAADDLIAQVVGPHVVAEKDPQADALRGVVDQSLSEAMRLILHHPEFQSVESLWRSLDLLARRIETDSKLQIILYDISAEEFAADLAAHEDLAGTGLFRLLADEPLSEGGDGGFSALLGLYTFEETPPHAELLARMGKIAAHIDAPFFTAISASVLETDKDDRHKLIAQAWDTLRAAPEAGYLGLATPRFLLRRPYGKRSEPVDAFDFEEFTMHEGLQGMLWANPVVAVAILLARARTEGGAQMELGKIMSLGEMPFHYVTDRHGDQVALPCTERNLTTLKMEQVISRGLMPLVAPRGRDEVRLASFQSLAGAEILGQWSSAPRPAPSSAERRPDLELPVAAAGTTESAGDALNDLDDLLAGFSDTAAPTDPAEIDADLAALLEGL